MPVLWFWPNVDAGSDGTSKGIRVFREREKPDNLHLFRNMFPEDFLRLLVHSTAIVGNSSVAIRECSFLGVPAVNVGTRQQGRERGAQRHRRGARSRGHCRRDSRARDARPADGRSSLRRRRRRPADRRLSRHRGAHDREAADLLMQTIIPPDRRQRIQRSRLRLHRAAAGPLELVQSVRRQRAS